MYRRVDGVSVQIINNDILQFDSHFCVRSLHHHAGMQILNLEIKEIFGIYRVGNVNCELSKYLEISNWSIGILQFNCYPFHFSNYFHLDAIHNGRQFFGCA